MPVRVSLKVYALLLSQMNVVAGCCGNDESSENDTKSINIRRIKEQKTN